jgi:4-diphosphocytidyl-2-C-methyl-D-erythritol kinase
VNVPLLEKAPAKINLSLRVLGRRADGYHEIESLVAFADIADVLRLQVDDADSLEINGPFASKSGLAADNLVVKALGALRGRIDGLKAGRFLLEKNLPVAAGIGGGSADAAAALRLLARSNNIALTDPRLMTAARSVGADVPVCLDPRSRIMRGIGEVLSEPLDLPRFPAMLVNPGVALATRDVFGNFATQKVGRGLVDVPAGFDALIEFLGQQKNDLTDAAVACVPAIGEVLDRLRASPGNRLVRMSGSGPTCFALFSSSDEATAAAKRLHSEHENWWVCATTIGGAPGQS